MKSLLNKAPLLQT